MSLRHIPPRFVPWARLLLALGPASGPRFHARGRQGETVPSSSERQSVMCARSNCSKKSTQHVPRPHAAGPRSTGRLPARLAQARSDARSPAFRKQEIPRPAPQGMKGRANEDPAMRTVTDFVLVSSIRYRGGCHEQLADGRSSAPITPAGRRDPRHGCFSPLYHESGNRPNRGPCRPKEPWNLTADPTCRNWVSFALNLVPFTGIAFLWSMAVLANRVGLREDRFFATVFLGSGLLFVAMLFAAVAVARGLIEIFAAPDRLSASSEAYAVGRATAHAFMITFGMKMGRHLHVCNLDDRRLIGRPCLHVGYRWPVLRPRSDTTFRHHGLCVDRAAFPVLGASLRTRIFLAADFQLGSSMTVHGDLSARDDAMAAGVGPITSNQRTRSTANELNRIVGVFRDRTINKECIL